MMSSVTIAILIGLLAGTSGWLLARQRYSSADGGREVKLTAELAAKQSRIEEWERSYRDGQAELTNVRGELAQRGAELAASQASLAASRTQTEEKVSVLTAARDELSNQFRTLAAEIMDEKSKRFVELNQESLAQLLAPFQTDLTGFRTKVEEVYVNGAKDRSALGEQLRILTELNGSMRDETNALTKALKGDSKAQGDWGEVILDRLLDSAGLIEGEHYKRQQSHKDEAGDRVIPDVVLYLPNDRQMVIDSKVTLTAYSEFAAATAPEDKEAALEDHLAAVRRHIKGLSEKNYQTLYALKSLDFVVMFMPLEGAFMTAVTCDQELFQFAWEKNVLLVSPSTLLFVVRTIAHVWQQEQQSRNALEIARRGALMYDKFVGFATDLLRVGDHLAKARESYDEARGKLTEGSGNLVGQVEKLRKLGLRPTKTLPPEFAGRGDDEVEESAVVVLLPPPVSD